MLFQTPVVQSISYQTCQNHQNPYLLLCMTASILRHGKITKTRICLLCIVLFSISCSYFIYYQSRESLSTIFMINSHTMDTNSTKFKRWIFHQQNPNTTINCTYNGRLIKGKRCCSEKVGISEYQRQDLTFIDSESVLESFIKSFSNKSILFIGDSLSVGTFNNLLRFLFSSPYLQKHSGNVQGYEMFLDSLQNENLFHKMSKHEICWKDHKRLITLIYNSNTSQHRQCLCVNRENEYLVFNNDRNNFKNFINISIVNTYRIIPSKPYDIYRGNQTIWKTDNSMIPTFYYGSMNSALFEHLLQQADNVIVNVGLHYQNMHTRDQPFYAEEYINLLKYVLYAMNENIKKSNNPSEKRHIWRATFPSHFNHDYIYMNSNNNTMIQQGLMQFNSGDRICTDFGIEVERPWT
eukprot:533055_1